ncbi:hypothetical protein [Pelagibacterium sp.]|uniref:hypothetical protein n=1 Tax=Pelagibacterium sp. TaxID=1967288 RepID=UPI003A9088CE
MTMPNSTARLIWSSLERLELRPRRLDGETIVFATRYQDGTEVALMIRSIVQTSLFRRSPAIAVVAASANQDWSMREVYLKTCISAPRNPDDLLFTAKLAIEIKSTAWAIAATGDMGDCLQFPGSPNPQVT